MKTLLRFCFDSPVRADLEADMALAIFAAECVYGKPRVRMETSYLVDAGGSTCVLDVGGEAGEAAARVFAGLAALRVGEEAFTVRRLPQSTGSTAQSVEASIRWAK
jgi:hypothetical protein